MEKLYPLLKKDDLTRADLGLNFPQAKAFIESKHLKITGTVHNGGRGRPSNTFSLTAKGRKAVEKYQAEHKGGRSRSASKTKATAKAGTRTRASKPRAKVAAKSATKATSKPRKASGAKPKVKVKVKA